LVCHSSRERQAAVLRSRTSYDQLNEFSEPRRPEAPARRNRVVAHLFSAGPALVFKSQSTRLISRLGSSMLVLLSAPRFHLAATSAMRQGKGIACQVPSTRYEAIAGGG
jgi:hypothetical protein